MYLEDSRGRIPRPNQIHGSASFEAPCRKTSKAEHEHRSRISQSQAATRKRSPNAADAVLRGWWDLASDKVDHIVDREGCVRAVDARRLIVLFVQLLVQSAPGVECPTVGRRPQSLQSQDGEAAFPPWRASVMVRPAPVSGGALGGEAESRKGAAIG
jgi:hypothetical protein